VKVVITEIDFLQRRTAIERKEPSIIVDTTKEA
jgi:hypothetical protein